MKHQTLSILLTAILAFALSACGGGGGGNGGGVPVAAAPPAAAPPAADPPVVVKIGPITGFGSVYVDGERFETSSDDTNVLKDDEIADEDDLEIGMIVKVRSSSQNSAGEWIADDIEFDENLKGPIDSVGVGSFVALGQTVNVLDETYFDDSMTFADLDEGEIVEVSGYRNEFDEIDASYVEIKLPGEVDEYEVLGQIRGLDTDIREFTIGGLTVRYGTIPALLDDLDDGLANDLLVEVEDGNLAYMAGDLVLDATKVEGENPTEFKDEDDNDMDDDVDEFEIEAVITAIVDGNTFMLGAIEVRHSVSTEFSGGTSADLVVGVRVEVEGDLMDTVLTAREIEFDDNEARISGLINAIDLDNDEVTVMGVVVSVAGAELRDSRDDIEPFALMNLAEGDFVEVEGTETDDEIQASSLERDDSDDDSEIRGVIDDFDATARTVTIFGKLIITNGQTQYECGDDTPCSDGADGFFGRLHEGQTVVDADWDGAVADTLLPVKELSLED